MRTDRTAQPIERWSDLWRPDLAGRVVLWATQPRDTLGLALRSLGYSANSANPAEIQEAADHLVELAPHAIWLEEADSSAPWLIEDDAVAAMGWAFDFWALKRPASRRPMSCPLTGPCCGNDNFVIPAHSTNKDAAEALINFLLRPEIAAQVIEANYYPMAHETARAYVDPAIRDDPVVYPTNEALAHAELQMPLSEEGRSNRTRRLYSFCLPSHNRTVMKLLPLHDRATSASQAQRAMSLRHKILLLLLAIMVPIALLLSSGIYHFVANNERSVWQSRSPTRPRSPPPRFTTSWCESRIFCMWSVRMNTMSSRNTANYSTPILQITRQYWRSSSRIHREEVSATPSATNRYWAISLPCRSRGGLPWQGWRHVRGRPSGCCGQRSGTSSWRRRRQVAGRSPQCVMDILWDVVGNISFGKSGHAYVVTADGGIIAHPDPAVVLAHTTLQDRPELFLQTTTPDTWSGNYELRRDCRPERGPAIPGTDWTIVAEVPISEAQSTSRLAVTFLFGVLLFGTLVIAPISLGAASSCHPAVGHSPSRRWRSQAATSTIASTCLQRDEIGQLAADFNVMVGELQARNVELSAKTDALSAEVIEHQATARCAR